MAKNLPVAPADAADVYPVLEAAIAALPEPPDDDDATARMVATVMAAGTPDALDAAWGGHNFESLAGHNLRIREVYRMASDFKDSDIGYFLLVRADDLSAGGAPVTITTGSTTVMAQLVKARQEGWLPADFEPVARETKSGRTALHLRFLGRPVVSAGEADF